jgi:hypothetical protein
MGTARQQHLHFLGREAEVAIENLFEEGFYAVYSRVNSPRSSIRYSPDVYTLLRERAFESPLEFEIEPKLSERAVKRDGLEISPIKVRMTLRRPSPDPAGRAASRLADFLDPAFPLGPSPAPGALPAGTSAQACYTTGGPPPVIDRTVAAGTLELEARATAHGGSGLSVSRESKVTFPFAAVISSGPPRTLFMRMIPVQQSQVMDRSMVHGKK